MPQDNERKTRIHPTAVVHPSAELGKGVTIGPYAIVNEDVVIGDDCVIGPLAIIDRWTVMGKRNKVYAGAVVGNEPQDLKFSGEKTQLIIGDDNMIREYATISRGTLHGGGVTRIGNGNLIMSYVHVAHDVQMGDGIVISHGSGIAGHVIIEDRAPDRRHRRRAPVHPDRRFGHGGRPQHGDEGRAPVRAGQRGSRQALRGEYRRASP